MPVVEYYRAQGKVVDVSFKTGNNCQFFRKTDASFCFLQVDSSKPVQEVHEHIMSNLAQVL